MCSAHSRAVVYNRRRHCPQCTMWWCIEGGATARGPWQLIKARAGLRGTMASEARIYSTKEWGKAQHRCSHQGGGHTEGGLY